LVKLDLNADPESCLVFQPETALWEMSTRHAANAHLSDKGGLEKGSRVDPRRMQQRLDC